MKNATFSILLFAAAAGSFVAGAWHSQRETVTAAPLAARTILYYVDPMHPAYKADTPGTAPDCGMPLEPVFAAGGEADASGPATTRNGIAVTAEKQQSIGVRVGTVEETTATERLRLFGRVTADETRVYPVIVGLDGYVREMSGATTGSQVRKDEWLLTYSAPDVRQPIQGYIALLESIDRETRNNTLDSVQMAFARAGVEQSVDRLLTMGMSPVQVDEIRRTRAVPPAVRMTAPVAGFVLARNVSVGQKVEKGTEVYRVADLGHLWILADLPAGDADRVRPGTVAEISLAGRALPIRARVSRDVLPQFDPATQSSKVRLDADNPGFTLRPDMFVDVDVQVERPLALFVPADAVVAAGLTDTVFVERRPGYFEPRRVEAGRRAGGRVEIRSGLRAGERIAVSGTFLLDSESRMRAARRGGDDHD